MKYLLLIGAGLLALIVIILLASGAFFSGTSTQPAPSTTTEQDEPAAPVELQSTTTASGETYIVDPSIPLSERCQPLTKACLEAQPEWDPTQSALGIRRVEPPQDTFRTDGREYEISENWKFENIGQTYQVVRLDTGYETGRENCPPNTEARFGPGPWSCPLYHPDEYTEFWILDEAGTILHHYRLTDEYTFMTYNAARMGWVGIPGSSSPSDTQPLIGVNVKRWNTATQNRHSDNSDETIFYDLNLATGELTFDRHENPPSSE